MLAGNRSKSRGPTGDDVHFESAGLEHGYSNLLVDSVVLGEQDPPHSQAGRERAGSRNC